MREGGHCGSLNRHPADVEECTYKYGSSAMRIVVTSAGESSPASYFRAQYHDTIDYSADAVGLGAGAHADPGRRESDRAAVNSLRLCPILQLRKRRLHCSLDSAPPSATQYTTHTASRTRLEGSKALYALGHRLSHAHILRVGRPGVAVHDQSLARYASVGLGPAAVHCEIELSGHVATALQVSLAHYTYSSWI
jgi:hypothetical protein